MQTAMRGVTHYERTIVFSKSIFEKLSALH